MDSSKGFDYKKIKALTTVAIVLALVDAYIAILPDLQAPETFLSIIENQTIRKLILWGVQFVVLGVGSTIVYFFVDLVYTLWWRIKNKSIWFNGTWYHIHDKENVRVGTVKIKQKFYDLEVTAINHDVSKEGEKTTWKYIGHQLPCDSNGQSFIGCYSAVRTQYTKYGFHILSTVATNHWGTPIMLKGEFGDALNLSEYKNDSQKNKNVYDKMGELYLYKATFSLKNFVGLFKENIETFIKRRKNYVTSFQLYEANVQKVVFKNRHQHDYQYILDAIEKNSLTGITRDEIDENVKKMLCRIVLCDNEIKDQEVNIINDIFGTKWNASDLQIVFDMNERNQIDENMRAFFGKLKQDEVLFSAFKIMIMHDCEALSKVDGVVKQNETAYIEKLKGLFKLSKSDVVDKQNETDYIERMKQFFEGCENESPKKEYDFSK